MTVKRRTAREWAIQLLTAADLNPPNDLQAFLESAWAQLGELGEDDGGGTPAKGKLKAFAEERVVGVLSGVKEIDAILVGLLDHWDLYRLGTVERAVLRMGIWELQHADIPPAVVINEAIDLTNWFSTPRSRKLVNGVLDKYAKSR